MDNLKETIYREVLPFVTHPTRYIGFEYNSITKKHTPDRLKILLAFPEVYEVGMSYLGFKILYGLINSREDSLCERVFSPWVDYEAALREKNLPLCSIESFTPINKFDLIGFTLQYEMTFTNVLQILYLGNIPLYSKDRREDDPIILGGGPVAFNPEPLADFFDAFLIGEGEEAINDIIDTVKKAKEIKLSRFDLLKEIAKIKGLYVPSFYDVSYNPDLTLKSVKPNISGIPEVIRKRTVKDFNSVYVPVSFPVPYMNIIQNRISVEIMRGCARGCRFCISGMTTRPVREKEVEGIIKTAKESYIKTGFDEISLTSLSSTDHTGIKNIVNGLNSEFNSKNVSVSLPSSRIDSFSVEVAAALNAVRKSTVTLAPEAGTQRLRNVINKCVTEEDLVKACGSAVKAGLHNLKLYFMLGLPTETEEDVLGISKLQKLVSSSCKGLGGHFKGVTISVSFFVPKPHTPFMWEKQDTFDQLKNKIDQLRKIINPKKLKWHSLELSFLEGVFSRGDRKLSMVIKKAFEKGARFDAWRETFKYECWLEAFKESLLDPYFYTGRERNYSEVFPWDHIDTGITREFLINENEKAKKGITSPDCRSIGCLNCGFEAECIKGKQADDYSLVQTGLHEKLNLPVAKYRVNYEKTYEIKFVSHLEIINSLKRMLNRSDLPICYTEGFNPHPRTSFSPALPVGVSSSAEMFDFELSKNISEDIILQNLLKEAPPGIKILKVSNVPVKTKMVFKRAVYKIKVPDLNLNLSDKEMPEAVEKAEIMDKDLAVTVKLDGNFHTNIYKLAVSLTGLEENIIKTLEFKRVFLF